MPRRARPNVVDSSAWLAYFSNEPGADRFAAAIENTRSLVVPAVCLTEVFKFVLRQSGESDALQAAALMVQGKVVDVDAPLALAAAKIGVDHKLPLADSIVYATALRVDGIIWTQDADFAVLAGVKYFPKVVR